jgi:hypothetical protein
MRLRISGLLLLTILLVPSTVHAASFGGQISSLGKGILSVTDAKGNTFTFNVSAETVVLYDGNKIAFGSLQVGMMASVDYEICQSSNKYPCASRIAATSHTTTASATASAEGKIGQLAKGSFSLNTGATFAVSASTVVTLNGAATNYSYLQVGDAATVEYVSCTQGACATSIVATRQLVK